ncbi:uncharacterized protein LOC123671366 [Harmonia axyridis]|uniref:uncharacterized protein LOC123671366 n=1 Tax=Harmonia axyridis TaxID=115357 RepID=UPI001E27626B|nr:uncharacterized protein LOC123671366 [Harmonia axyridis]
MFKYILVFLLFIEIIVSRSALHGNNTIEEVAIEAETTTLISAENITSLKNKENSIVILNSTQISNSSYNDLENGTSVQHSLGTSFEVLWNRNQKGMVANNFGECKYCVT